MPESAGEQLSRRLSAFPPEAVRYFEEAFTLSATLTEDVRKTVLETMIDRLRIGANRLNGAVLIPITGLVERDAGRIAYVYSVLFGLLSESTAGVEDFIDQAKRKFFTEEQEPIARSIIKSICDARPVIAPLIDRSQLAQDALPSFRAMDVAVDIRLRFVEGKVKTTVPIAIISIDTDTVTQKVSMQINRAELEETVRRLTILLQDMKSAENFEVKHD